jgi:hypothetical protein
MAKVVLALRAAANRPEVYDVRYGQRVVGMIMLSDGSTASQWAPIATSGLGELLRGWTFQRVFQLHPGGAWLSKEPQANTRLRADARSRDAGVRPELA